jgi:hypothetical protein
MRDESSKSTGPTSDDTTTCAPSPPPEEIGPAISSAAGSRARTSATPGGAPESTEAEAGCGLSSPGSLAWYDRASSSWKTWQRFLDGELEEFSATWPNAGMTRSGIAYRRRSLAPRTKGSESFLLPTPVKSLANVASSLTDMMIFRETSNGVPRKVSNQGVDGSVGLFRLVRLWTGMIPTAGFVAWMMGFPVTWTRLEHSATP